MSQSQVSNTILRKKIEPLLLQKKLDNLLHREELKTTTRSTSFQSFDKSMLKQKYCSSIYSNYQRGEITMLHEAIMGNSQRHKWAGQSKRENHTDSTFHLPIIVRMMRTRKLQLYKETNSGILFFQIYIHGFVPFSFLVGKIFFSINWICIELSVFLLLSWFFLVKGKLDLKNI